MRLQHLSSSPPNALQPLPLRPLPLPPQNNILPPNHPSTSNPLLITDADSAFYYFTLPKYPKIPANPEHCNYFLSFRLSFGNGGLPRDVAVSHVMEVFFIAKEYFGERVRCWNEMHRMRRNGYYTPTVVEEAEEEVRKLCKAMIPNSMVTETVVETPEEENVVEVGASALLG
ncbi:hypothetical protein FOXYS1_8473 [Fusarium oxysporum]|uniref:Uncharacterized protein n=1 Tax=Fusarium oxysporum TaxID=5507 RepID=A0A8H5A9X1_FUSOX|nr:hypothetical protein FOXYS1_8473 [Fusarium oxysporum]